MLDKSKQTTMKVQEAIKTVETLGGYKFLRRYSHFNLDVNRTETAYVFDGVVFDCLSQLRFYARQFNYTYGVTK